MARGMHDHVDAALVLEVTEKVGALFALYPDLLDGFRVFLPDAATGAEPRARGARECAVSRGTTILC
jgi:histone deacetylase complex regulatory component SIN3